MYVRQPVLPMFRRRQATYTSGIDSRASPARIARIWRGRTARAKADAYESYLREAGILPLADKALAAQFFREDRGAETEFVAISFWEGLDAMSVFAGDDPARIRHLPRDEEFLLELPDRAQILRVLGNAGDES